MSKRKKYDPSRNRQRLERDLLSNTFFYHGSMLESVGALAGNLKYRLTDAQASQILKRKNTWSGMILAFCNSEFECYTRAGYFRIEKQVDRHQLDKIIVDEQLNVIDKIPKAHICGTGYFIIPDHMIDMKPNRETVTRIFEEHNPYDYSVTVLAAMLRESENKKQEGLK